MTDQVFEYALLRAVPRVDRGELVNVGVIVYCQDTDYLAAEVRADPDRLRMLDPDVDVPAVQAALETLRAACAGDPDGGPIAAERPGIRFRWLTAPRSTVVQPGPVHSGVTTDPAAELTHLFAKLVA